MTNDSTATLPRTAGVSRHIEAGARGGVEAIKCLALGLRDGLRPRVALTSLLIWLMVIVFWCVVFWIWREDVKSLATAALLLIAYGVAQMLMPVAGPATVSAMASGANALGAFAFLLSGPVAAVVTGLVVFGCFMLLCMLSVRILLELLLMGRIQAQCLQRYPALSRGVDNSWRRGLRDALGTLATFVIGGLLCLVIPLVGGLLLFLLASYLNVRSLVGDALDGVATDDERRAVIRSQRLNMLLLGLLGTLLMLVPLAGLVAPSVLGASVCHLCMRQVVRMRIGM